MAKNASDIKRLSKILLDTCMRTTLTEERQEHISDLIKQGADVNYADEFGNAPLSFAIGNNVLELAKLLLENKANPNYMNTRFPKFCPNSLLIKY